MTEPIGWASMRGSLHYKSVLPSVPDVGMHTKLHKNLTKRLQPKDVVSFSQNNVEMARRILYRQRVALKLFSGSRLNLKGSTPHETSARLHRQPLRQSTCPEGFYQENVDVMSNMKSEGSTLLTEASLYGTLPQINTERKRGMSPIPDSALSQYNDKTDKLQKLDPEKLPDSRGYVVKLNKPIVYKKKYTESEIQNIVRRLTDYDPTTHPAESKGPSFVTQVPRQSMIKVKKCSSEEVQAIVERLYRFDTSKWPPESKSRPAVYSGRPQRTQTAPAAISPPAIEAPPSSPPLPLPPSSLSEEGENKSASAVMAED